MPIPTVLVVEDDVDNRQLLIDTLTRTGFAVQPAGDGREVLELARSVDAVLMDVSLPGLSGLDLCQLLRADPQTARLPVLLISGHATEQRVRAGLAAGADGYVVKPFSPMLLVAQLRQLLGIPASAASVAAASSASLSATYRTGARLITPAAVIKPARSA